MLIYLPTVWLSALSCILLTSQVYSYPSKSVPDSSRSSSTENFDDREFGAKINIPKDYQFAYEVRDAKTTNFQNRFEVSKNGLLQGSYSHLAPDGVVRTVIYTDDGTTGYQVIMKEEPTNITVIGSGLPGDPLREGKSTTAASEDFHTLLNLINLSGKFGDKEGTKFGFPASSIEFPVFGNSLSSKSTSSSEDSDNSRNENKRVDSASFGSTSAEVTSGSIDEELENALSFGSKTTYENSKDDASDFFEKIATDSMASDDGESAIFVSKDALGKDENFENRNPTNYKQDSSEDTSEQSHESEGGIPVVVLDQAFLRSLNSQGAMSTQKLVQAIQQAMQAAITSNTGEQVAHQHAVLKNIDNNILPPSPEKPVKTSTVESKSNSIHDSTLTPQTGVPVIVIDKKVFDSLDEPGSKMTRQQFATGIQQALFSALESTAPNKQQSDELTVSNQSVKMTNNKDFPLLENAPITNSKEVHIADSESTSLKGGIPVVALDKKLFDSLDSPGSPLSKQQLVQSIQGALQKAVDTNTLGTSETYNGLADKNEIEQHIPHNNAKPSIPATEAKFTPVVAIKQELFESLDRPGSSMTKQQLVEAIQNALHSALEITVTNNKDTTEAFANEIPKEQLIVSSDAKGEASGAEKIIYPAVKIDNAIGDADRRISSKGFIPVIALDRSLFESFGSGQKGQKKNLVESIQQALNSAIESTASSDPEKFGDSDEEEESLEKTLSSSSASELESNGIMTGASGTPFTVVHDNNQNDDNDQDDKVITFDQNFFKSLEEPGSTMNGEHLVQAMQQALNSAMKSSSTENVPKSSGGSLEAVKNKNKHEQLNSKASVITNSKSFVADDTTSSNPGGGIPVVAIPQELFESLDSPGSSINRQQFVQAIQNALQSAIKSTPSLPDKDSDHGQTNENVEKSLSKIQLSDDKTLEGGATSFTIVQKNEHSEDDNHSIPVIALGQDFYKSLESQGRSGNNHPIVIAMQQALKEALQGSNTSSNDDQESDSSLTETENEEKQNGFIFETPKSQTNGASAPNDGTSIPGGGIPVLAFDQALFESLGAPGSTMTKQQLIEAIQQAMDAAIKSTANLENISENGLVNKSAVNRNSEISSGKLDQKFTFPHTHDVTGQDDSGEKQTTIVFENNSGLGFKSFANSMKDFLKMHNQVIKPVEKSSHT